MKFKKSKFAGRGMHEFYASNTSNSKMIRKREKCKYYNHETAWCEKIFNQCVGPTICKKYSEKSSTPKNSLIGTVINSKYYGKGTIVSESDTFCTIQYDSVKIQCSKNNLSKFFHPIFDDKKFN